MKTIKNVLLSASLLVAGVTSAQETETIQLHIELDVLNLAYE